MEVFRLSREQFARPLSGKGAALAGGRWNSVGVELIYTAENRSLAMAEVAVHFTLATLPSDYVMTTIVIPDETAMQEVPIDKLQAGWDAFPHAAFTRTIGDQFVIANTHCILKVPSAVTHGDHNLLINPHHADFKKIRISLVRKFPFDKRILK